MTDGTSQGLFIVVAIVIFGIFVVLAYILFEDTLSPALASMFNEATEQASENLDKEYSLVGRWYYVLNSENDGYPNTEPYYEFMQYVDLAPIFDKHGTGEYLIEFDIKATNEGLVKMYSHNGEDARYSIGTSEINATTEYTHHKITVQANFKATAPKESMLAFFGENYETERFPTVKNVRIYKKNT